MGLKKFTRKSYTRNLKLNQSKNKKHKKHRKTSSNKYKQSGGFSFSNPFTSISNYFNNLSSKLTSILNMGQQTTEKKELQEHASQKESVMQEQEQEHGTQKESVMQEHASPTHEQKDHAPSSEKDHAPSSEKEHASPISKGSMTGGKNKKRKSKKHKSKKHKSKKRKLNKKTKKKSRRKKKIT
tara:strand:+ start:4288 stop:4836 length:549 start_codon:yes stop_codon:yes gene_type:complete